MNIKRSIITGLALIAATFALAKIGQPLATRTAIAPSALNAAASTTGAVDLAGFAGDVTLIVSTTTNATVVLSSGRSAATAFGTAWTNSLVAASTTIAAGGATAITIPADSLNGGKWLGVSVTGGATNGNVSAIVCGYPKAE